MRFESFNWSGLKLGHHNFKSSPGNSKFSQRTTPLEVYWPSCSILFYNNPEDCPIACFGSLIPAACGLGVLPKLVEKNGMYLYRGLLYTCFGLSFPTLVSISPVPSSLHIPEFFIISDPLLVFFLDSSTNVDFFLFFFAIIPHLSLQWDLEKEKR